MKTSKPSLSIHALALFGALALGGCEDVVFTIPGTEVGTTGVFSAQLSNSTPGIRHLSAAGHEVIQDAVKPAGIRVVYAARTSVFSDDISLWSHRIDDRSGVRIVPALASSAVHVAAEQFAVSPDFQRVVYLAKDANGIGQLYATNLIDGRDDAVLSANPPPEGLVSSYFAISPDSGRVVYAYRVPVVLGGNTYFVFRLYSNNLDGTDEIELASPSFAAKIRELTVTPDSQHAVYIVGNSDGSREDIHTSPLDGSGSDVNLGGYYQIILDISPDSSRIIYRDDLYSLMSHKPDGTGEVALTGGDTFAFHLGFPASISADSSRVVFAATASSQPFSGSDWYVSNLDGTQKTHLDPARGDAAISPDSSRIAYVSDGSDESSTDDKAIYVRDIDGTNRIAITSDLADITELAISPNSRHIVYVATELNDADGVRNLYASKLDGTGTVTLSPATSRFTLSPYGTRVVYVADGILYSTTLDGSLRVQLTEPLDDQMDYQVTAYPSLEQLQNR